MPVSQTNITTTQQYNTNTTRAKSLPLSIVFCILYFVFLVLVASQNQNSRTAEQQNRKPKMSRPSSVVQYSSCCRPRRRRRRQLVFVFILSCLEASCRTRNSCNNRSTDQQMKAPTITVHNHSQLTQLELESCTLHLGNNRQAGNRAENSTWMQLHVRVRVRVRVDRL
jgi:hypothetical protein